MKVNGVKNNREEFIKQIDDAIRTMYTISVAEKQELEETTEENEKLKKSHEEHEADSSLVNSDRYQKEYNYQLYSTLYNRRKAEYTILSKTYHIKRLVNIKTIVNNKDNNQLVIAEQFEEYFNTLKSEVNFECRMKRVLGLLKIHLSNSINEYIKYLLKDLIIAMVVIEMQPMVNEFNDKYDKRKKEIKQKELILNQRSGYDNVKDAISKMKEKTRINEEIEKRNIEIGKNRKLVNYTNQFGKETAHKSTQQILDYIIIKCDQICETYETKKFGDYTSSNFNKIKMIKEKAKHMKKNILTPNEINMIQDKNADLKVDLEKYERVFDIHTKYPYYKKTPFQELVKDNGELIIQQLLFDEVKEQDTSEVKRGKTA